MTEEMGGGGGEGEGKGRMEWEEGKGRKRERGNGRGRGGGGGVAECEGFAQGARHRTLEVAATETREADLKPEGKWALRSLSLPSFPAAVTTTTPRSSALLTLSCMARL